jgi:signal transduction histidine kinase
MPRSSVSPKAPGSSRAAAWRVLRRDPISIAGTAVLAGIALVYLLPVIPREKLAELSGGTFLVLLCAWAAVAMLSGVRRLPVPEERRFWAFLGGGFCSLLAAMLLSLSPLWEGGRPSVRLVYDAMVVVFNLLLILATSEAPHRLESWSRTPANRWIVYVGAATLGVGMTAYFDWIPYFADPLSFQGRIPAFYLFLSLDAILLYRTGSLLREAPRGGWRSYYGLLMITSLLVTAGDLLDAFNVLGLYTYSSGAAIDFLWYLSYPPLALGARYRFLSFRESEEPARERGAFESPLLSFALLVPLVHFSLSITGQLAPNVDNRQRIAALCTLVTLLLLLRWQESRTAKWQQELEVELEEARQRLLTSEKLEAVGRLAGGVAHDFNNKLAIILGYTEVLEAEAARNARLAEPVTAIRAATEHAARMTEQLLSIGRRQYVRLRTLDFNQTLETLTPGLRKILGGSVKLELVQSLRPTFGKVDEQGLRRALEQLATNSREAMREGGSFRIEVRTHDVSDAGAARRPTFRSGRFVQIEVVDNGPGVSPEALPHLFEPFFSTKGTNEGRGLGLATLRGFVEQCGGFVSVDSAPGRGFTCQLHFPRVDEPVAGTLSHET